MFKKYLIKFLVSFLFLFGVQLSFTQKVEAGVNLCYMATGSAKHVLCWLDLKKYTPTPGVPFTITYTLSDGSLFTTTLNNTTTTTPAIVALPTYSGSALGNSAYTGVLSTPAVYGSTGTSSTNLSANTLTDPLGVIQPSVTIIGSDAETLDTGDGGSGNLIWTSSGTPWSLLEILPVVGSTATFTPICTLTGVGTTVAKCVPFAGGNNAAYILSSSVTPSQDVTMSATTAAKQGYAFAINLALLAVGKSVPKRFSPGDQFTVLLARSGTTVASVSTSGTQTAIQSTSNVVTPGYTYQFTDSGSGVTPANINFYAASYNCVNAISSSTVLPSGDGRTFTFVPAPDDQVTCTFSNNYLTFTNVAATPTKTVPANSTVTDNFTLNNTSAVAGTFVVQAPTVTNNANATSITPSGYVYNSITYPNISTLNAAIAANPATPATGSIVIGLIYSAPVLVGGTVSVSFKALIQRTTAQGTSSVVTATETDTMGAPIIIPTVTLTKTGTTAASPGGLISYNLFAKNTGAVAADGTNINDPLPSGVVVVGTATCSVTGGAVCGTTTTTSSNISGSITTFPINSTVTYAFSATAAASGLYSNTATLTPPTGTVATSSLTTTVSQTNGISKTVRNVTAGGTASQNPDTALPGDVLEYGLSFINNTGVSINTFSFVDALPTQLGFKSASCGVLPTGITSCSITNPSVGSNGTVIIKFTGTLISGSTLSSIIQTSVF